MTETSRTDEAKQTWRDAVPWQHPMTGVDKLLVVAVLGLPLLMLVSMPLRPLLLASHPVALSAATGSLSAVGAGAAFARLTTFLLADAAGAAAMTGLVAGLGYGIGQHAVDVVLMIDDYALWITLGLVALVTARGVRRGIREERAQRA